MKNANLTVQPLDLTWLESTRAAADELRAKHPRIDPPSSNAGVMLPPKPTTRDGFEPQLATNHLGHLARAGPLPQQLLLAVPGSRVVTVSSLAHRLGARINLDDLQGQRSSRRVAADGQSKPANLLCTSQLQRRLSGAATTPGVRGGQDDGPGGLLGGQGLPETGPLQRAIPPHRHPAPPVDGLRTADRVTFPLRPDPSQRQSVMTDEAHPHRKAEDPARAPLA